MSLCGLKKELRKNSSARHAKLLQRYFKTGPGEYAEGDIFIGLTVPQIRAVAKVYKDISLKDAVGLLKSEVHEERMLSLFILISKFAKANAEEKKKIYEIYLAHTKYINNWDLVDLSSLRIVGAFLIDKDKTPLYRLAKSKNLWERRIAVLATFYYIRNNNFEDCIKIAEILLNDKEDLIHKAVGWMLREVGKRDLACEEHFLKDRYKIMPRTMLRYAIERFPEGKRRMYLSARQDI